LTVKQYVTLVVSLPLRTPEALIDSQEGAPIPAYLLWIVIVIGAILVIAVIVLIVRTRRIP
jgi:hypothetical protein